MTYMDLFSIIVGMVTSAVIFIMIFGTCVLFKRIDDKSKKKDEEE